MPTTPADGEAVLTFANLEQRPDLTAGMWSMPNDWPPFMLRDPVATLLFGRLPEVFPAFQLVGLDAAGAVVAKVNSVPFVWSGDDSDLPTRGWDGVLERAFDDARLRRTPTAVSLLEARVVPSLRGLGLSRVLLDAARSNARERGFRDVVAPVRPAAKSAEPHVPMVEYASRARDDGLPSDPWLRTHVSLGGRLVGVCPLSMVIPGSLADWRLWTGLPFEASGPVEVPGALVPVHVAAEQDLAIYVEPNVWVHHRLG